MKIFIIWIILFFIDMVKCYIVMKLFCYVIFIIVFFIRSIIVVIFIVIYKSVSNIFLVSVFELSGVIVVGDYCVC